MKRLVSYFHLLLPLHKMSIAEIVTFALGLKFDSDPDVTSPPFTEAQLQALANKVLKNISKKVTKPGAKLTAQQQNNVDALSRALVSLKYEVERAANEKAKGSRALFETIARRIGFLPKGPSKNHGRIFETLYEGKGAFHVRVPVEGSGRRTTYVYQYGITTKEDVLPAVWQPAISIPYTDLVVKNIPSGSIIALHYAAVLIEPKPRKGNRKRKQDKTDAGKSGSRSRGVNILPTNESGFVTLEHGIDFMRYSEVIYIVIP